MKLADHYAEYEKYLLSRHVFGDILSKKLTEIAQRYADCEFADIFMEDDDFAAILNGEATIDKVSYDRGVYEIQLDASDLYEVTFGEGRWHTSRYNNDYERFDGDLPDMGSVNKRIFSDLANEFNDVRFEKVVPFFVDRYFENIIVECGKGWQDYVRAYPDEHAQNVKIFEMMLALKNSDPGLVQRVADNCVHIYSQLLKINKGDLLEYGKFISEHPAFITQEILEIYWRYGD